MRHVRNEQGLYQPGTAGTAPGTIDRKGVTMADSAFSHVAVCVPDIDLAQRFYTEVFGFKPASDRFGASGPDMDRLSNIEGCDFQALFMRKDGLFIELTAFKDAKGAEAGYRGRPLPYVENEYGFVHFAFRVADIDKTAARLTEMGGEVLTTTLLEMMTPGATSPTKLLFCTDPYGNRIELIQHPDQEAAESHADWMHIKELGWADEALDSAAPST